MTQLPRVVAEPAKASWLGITFVSGGLTRQTLPWFDAVHAIGNRVTALFLYGMSKPLYVLFYDDSSQWNHKLAATCGVVQDGVWLQSDRGVAIYVHVALDTTSSDVGRVVADAYRRVFQLVIDKTERDGLGELADDGLEQIIECIDQTVNDPVLAGVFAGPQPCALPEPADWILQEYVRVSMTLGTCQLAELVSLEEDEQKAQRCGAFPGARYRVEVNREYYPDTKMKSAWYWKRGRRLCLAGDAGLALAQRFSLPVVAAECPDGELPVWVVDPPVVGVQWYDPVELMLQESAVPWANPQPGLEREPASAVWPLSPHWFPVPRIGWLADRPAVMASPELGVYFGSVCRNMLVRRDVAEAVVEASQGEVKIFDLDDRSIE